MSREVMQQALEALEFLSLDFFMLDPISPGREESNKAITALRTALAQQPEPVEPAAWIQPDHLQKARVAPFLCRVEPTQRCPDFVPLYTAPLAAPSVPVEIATSADAKSDALEKAGEAYSNAAPIVPAGWKLVPVKPTQEMLNAALDVGEAPIWICSENCVEWIMCAEWRAMLDAAPEAPSGEGEK